MLVPPTTLTDEPADAVPRTDSEELRACTFPALRAFAIEPTDDNAEVLTMVQTPKVSLVPPRFASEYAQYWPVAQVPTARCPGAGAVRVMLSSGHTTVYSSTTVPPGTALIAYSTSG